MNILLVEPFLTGSHAAWARGLARAVDDEVTIIGLPGHSWKWRMQTGAIELGEMAADIEFEPDLIIASDMLDLPRFAGFSRPHFGEVPQAVYFHENQLTYPWSAQDRDAAAGRDLHYAFINLASAIMADDLYFNSEFHRDSFLGELPEFLAAFPEKLPGAAPELLAEKSRVLYPGVELKKFDPFINSDESDKSEADPPLIVYNHRWEYDKNPEEFFEALFELDERGFDFRLAVLGESFQVIPPIFEQAKDRLSEKIIHYGYAKDFADYARILAAADFAPVTSRQEFFGISVIEAAYCGAVPLLPRRLTYPELFPVEQFGDLFYDEGKLADKIIAAAKNRNRDLVEQVRIAAARFGWSVLAPQYGESFRETVGR